LGSHTKNEKIQENIYQKNIQKKSKNNRSEKMMLEYQKRPNLVEEVQKCKRLKFDSISLTNESPVEKENSI
jgi:hypothetical protein